MYLLTSTANMTTNQKITVSVLMFLVATLATLYGLQRQAAANDCLYFYHSDAKGQIEFIQWALGQPEFANREIVAINDFKTEACFYQY